MLVTLSIGSSLNMKDGWMVRWGVKKKTRGREMAVISLAQRKKKREVLVKRTVLGETKVFIVCIIVK